MFVTTITYYTLTLADFSPINYCLKLSQTLHLHTSHVCLLLRPQLLNNWVVGLLFRNWAKTANHFAYIARTSETKNGASQLCCVTRGNAKVTRYSPTPVAGWHHCGMLRRNRIPMLLHDVIASSCVAMHGAEKTPLSLLLRSMYSVASCLPVGYVATLCCVIQRWVDMSQYYMNINFKAEEC
jgi:hypothetical protein